MHPTEIAKRNEALATCRIRAQGFTIINEDPRKPEKFGGWPDRLAIDENGVLHFFEVKSGGHALDPHQRKVLQALNRYGTVHILYYTSEGEFVREEIFNELL